MFRRNRRPQTNSTELLDQWLTVVLPGSRGDAARVADACRDVVDAYSVSSGELLAGALRRFGYQLGSEGWLLSDLTRWINLLGDLAGPDGGVLDTFDSGIALARGWADGHLQGAQASECIDGLTGLVTLPVLRLRLRQVYEQCTALGLATEQVYCLVVIDTDLGERAPLERDAALVVLAEQARKVFNSGETVAVKDGRVLVLASRTDETRNALLDLLGAVRVYPLLASGTVFGWLEDLPVANDLVDTYLIDVAA